MPLLRMFTILINCHMQGCYTLHNQMFNNDFDKSIQFSETDEGKGMRKFKRQWGQKINVATGPEKKQLDFRILTVQSKKMKKFI